MFTDNYKALQDWLFRGTSSSIDMIDTSGTQQAMSTTRSMVSGGVGRNMATPTISYDYGLHFGTGSTPAAASDYALESRITSGLSFTKGELALYEEQEGRYIASVSHAITNTSDAEINIYEIGVVANYFNGSNTAKYYLMERTVLTEPITLAAGETKLVTYKITFNQTMG